MLKSMTGFGNSRIETPDFVLTLELKSVNNKFLKITGRVSEEFSFLQREIEERIRRYVARGSIHYVALLEPTHNADLYDIDMEVLEKYSRSLKASGALSSSSGANDLDLQALLPLPGVVRVREAVEVQRDALLPVAEKGVDEAMQGLVSMRTREGKHLHSELSARVNGMTRQVQDISKLAPEAARVHYAKLTQRVNDLLEGTEVAVNQDDVVREVAILAEKADITEEISRFESHLMQFDASLDSPEPIGRKLEFITQEMFRESNTMAAKSTTPELSRAIVDLKADVDRLKEQVMNIE